MIQRLMASSVIKHSHRLLSSKCILPVIKIHIETSLDENRIPIAEALSKRIIREFKDSNVQVLPTEKPYATEDAPFTVVINEKTLDIGVIDLQHFNPEIKEEIHVSNLNSRLMLELGLTKPEIKPPGKGE